MIFHQERLPIAMGDSFKVTIVLCVENMWIMMVVWMHCGWIVPTLSSCTHCSILTISPSSSQSHPDAAPRRSGATSGAHAARKRRTKRFTVIWGWQPNPPAVQSRFYSQEFDSSAIDLCLFSPLMQWHGPSQRHSCPHPPLSPGCRLLSRIHFPSSP